MRSQTPKAMQASQTRVLKNKDQNVNFEERTTSKFRENFNSFGRSSLENPKSNSTSPQRTARKQIFSKSETVDPEINLGSKDLTSVKIVPLRVEKVHNNPFLSSLEQTNLSVDGPHFENMLLKRQIENLKIQVEHSQRYIKMLQELTQKEFYQNELDPISAININSARHDDELTTVRFIEKQKEHFEMEYRKAQAEIKQLTEEKAAILRDYEVHSKRNPVAHYQLNPMKRDEGDSAPEDAAFNSCPKEGFWQKMYKRKAEEVEDLVKQLENQKAQYQREKAALLSQLESFKIKDKR